MPDQDDPFKPADGGTVLRPRPGAGRRGADERPSASARAPVLSTHESLTSPQAMLGAGLNPLVRAATPLMMLVGQLRATPAMSDVAGLRRYVLEEIRRFEESARSAGMSNEVTLAARYALCAALDEAVLSTPWGAHTEWSQQTLLVTLHREAWGGEKFFEMLSRISQDPGRHIDLMELQYICIALGFAGRYHVSAGGSAQLTRIQQDLYRAIRTYRGVPPPELSLRWRGVEDRRNPLIRYVPWWVVAASVLGLLAVAFTFYYARLANAAEPVLAQLTRLGLEDFNAPVAPAAVAGPTLKQLLREEEARRLVSVDEQDGRTVITPLAPDLFASGSAAVNPAYRDMLARVANAINQVPGRVLVKGHTDNQPIRSLRYKNNYELSQDRAESVVRILQETLDNDSRLKSTGVGSDEPRVRPESEGENRARNRRVEIIHVRST